MATLAEALAVIGAYRAELLTSQVNESSPSTLTAFSSPLSLFRSPLANIMATGVGVRVRNGEIIPDEIVIKVYVYEKADLGDATPTLTSQTFQGIPIDVEAMPIQKALTITPSATTPAQHQQRQRPAIGGLEIRPKTENYVGTFGCLVRRGSSSSGSLFVLSNNHVLANTNQLPIGSEFTQPFSSSSSDIIARLSEFEPIRFSSPGTPAVNSMDAAIAAVVDDTLVSTGQIFGISNYDPVISSATPGMRVTKSGRTTGVTSGQVTAINVNGVAVDFGSPGSPLIAVFNNCIEIATPSGGPFSNPGDSGSVILDEATGRPVALLFAGNGIQTTSCDFATVCSRFGVVPA